VSRLSCCLSFSRPFNVCRTAASDDCCHSQHSNGVANSNHLVWCFVPDRSDPLPLPETAGYHALLVLKPPILKPQTVNPKLQTLGKHLLVELGTVMGPLSLRTKPNIFHKSHSSGLALAPERQLWLQRIGLPATLPLITARGEVIFVLQAARCSLLSQADRELVPVTHEIMYHFMTFPARKHKHTAGRKYQEGLA
jgi:hypothetical protein